jgi:acetylglutamate synthase
MIKIEGLTARQVQIMELLWGCETQDEAEELILSLPTEKDQWEGLSLMRIALDEVMEQQGEIKKYEAIANLVIDRARRP